MATPSMDTRSRSKERQNNSIVQEIVKDLLKSDTFLRLVKDSVDKKISGMKEELDRQQALLFELQVDNDKKTTEIAKLNATIKEQNTRLNNIDNKLNAEEQYSRRNCLRLFGYPEKPNENTDNIMIELANNTLKVDLSLDDIERSHRVGPKKEPGEKGGKPRGIIIKFKSYRKRIEVLKNRRKLKGTKNVIVEDLTAKNQSLLNEARTHPNVATAWSKDGLITVLLKGNAKVKKLIRSREDFRSL